LTKPLWALAKDDACLFASSDLINLHHPTVGFRTDRASFEPVRHWICESVSIELRARRFGRIRRTVRGTSRSALRFQNEGVATPESRPCELRACRAIFPEFPEQGVMRRRAAAPSFESKRGGTLRGGPALMRRITYVLEQQHSDSASEPRASSVPQPLALGCVSRREPFFVVRPSARRTTPQFPKVYSCALALAHSD
jgi:hypothetical protein